jgi:hypothetical protein
MIYLPPSVTRFFAKRIVFSTWMDHLPFGYDLVDALQPSMIVELGSQAGLSYFCLCQSVAENKIDARCYAVDTWAGDEHTGEYDDQIYNGVATHNNEHYADFSTLLRMRFEEAVQRFEPESIDLLHIDGFHTYDAVNNDFETWYPKVKPGGVIMFHDIAARIMDFGAWKFWKELEPRYPSFMFHHGFGLGLLRKPGEPKQHAPLLSLLFEADERQKEELRAFYVHAAEFQDLLRREDLHKKTKAAIIAQAAAKQAAAQK